MTKMSLIIVVMCALVASNLVFASDRHREGGRWQEKSARSHWNRDHKHKRYHKRHHHRQHHHGHRRYKKRHRHHDDLSYFLGGLALGVIGSELHRHSHSHNGHKHSRDCGRKCKRERYTGDYFVDRYGQCYRLERRRYRDVYVEVSSSECGRGW